MVPAPMMPTFWIGRSGVSAGTSAILLVARSAKNRWRSERDSGVIIRLRNRSRSLSRPSSMRVCVATCTASTHLTGAGRCLAMPRAMLRANWK